MATARCILAHVIENLEAVRVERLDDISGEDCIAEGIALERDDGDAEARTRYFALWDSLNAKRGFGWATNPWVWVVEFRRV